MKLDSINEQRKNFESGKRFDWNASILNGNYSWSKWTEIDLNKFHLVATRETTEKNRIQRECVFICEETNLKLKKKSTSREKPSELINLNIEVKWNVYIIFEVVNLCRDERDTISQLKLMPLAMGWREIHSAS